jgi:hypothetical protein
MAAVAEAAMIAIAEAVNFTVVMDISRSGQTQAKAALAPSYAAPVTLMQSFCNARVTMRARAARIADLTGAPEGMRKIWLTWHKP